MRAKEPTADALAASGPFAGSADRAERTRLEARDPDSARDRPLLMVDIDGVISLFGFAGRAPWTQPSSAQPSSAQPAAAQPVAAPAGSFQAIDGIPHFLSPAAAAHLRTLATDFDLVWASGWEEKAEEYLPRLLDLPSGLPFLRFARSPGRGNAHWKLAAIEEYAGARALAWVDDAFNDACHAWADARPAPTLLVQTAPERGLTATEAQLLLDWASSTRPTATQPQRLRAGHQLVGGGDYPRPQPQSASTERPGTRSNSRAFFVASWRP